MMNIFFFAFGLHCGLATHTFLVVEAGPGVSCKLKTSEPRIVSTKPADIGPNKKKTWLAMSYVLAPAERQKETANAENTDATETYTYDGIGITIYRLNGQLYIKYTGEKDYTVRGLVSGLDLSLSNSKLTATPQELNNDSLFAGSVSLGVNEPSLYIFNLEAVPSNEIENARETVNKFLLLLQDRNVRSPDIEQPQNLIKYLYAFTSAQQNEFRMDSNALTVFSVNKDDQTDFSFVYERSKDSQPAKMVDIGNISIEINFSGKATVTITFQSEMNVQFQFGPEESPEVAVTISHPYSFSFKTGQKYIGHFDVQVGQSSRRIFILRMLGLRDLYFLSGVLSMKNMDSVETYKFLSKKINP